MAAKKRWQFLAQIYANQFCTANSLMQRELNFDADVIIECNDSSTQGTESMAVGWRNPTATIAGVGTLTSSGTIVTVTTGNTNSLQPGFWIVANSVVKKIISITDSNHFVVDSDPSWINKTWTYSASTTFGITAPTPSDLSNIWSNSATVLASFIWKEVSVNVPSPITGACAWKKYIARRLLDYQYQDLLFDMYPQYKSDVFSNLAVDYLGNVVTSARRDAMNWYLTNPSNNSNDGNMKLYYETIVSSIDSATTEVGVNLDTLIYF